MPGGVPGGVRRWLLPIEENMYSMDPGQHSVDTMAGKFVLKKEEAWSFYRLQGGERYA